MEDTIQYGHSRDGIPEELCPIRLFNVSCKDQGFVILVPLVDHLEEQMKVDLILVIFQSAQDYRFYPERKGGIIFLG